MRRVQRGEEFKAADRVEEGLGRKAFGCFSVYYKLVTK